jgi:hypothetical protein
MYAYDIMQGGPAPRRDGRLPSSFAAYLYCGMPSTRGTF